MVRALVDWGEERNPCKYSKWVVGMVVVFLTNLKVLADAHGGRCSARQIIARYARRI